MGIGRAADRLHDTITNERKKRKDARNFLGDQVIGEKIHWLLRYNVGLGILRV